MKDRLLRLKPNASKDVEGWVYVYFRALDEEMVKKGRLSHVILYKVGRTKNHPSRRVTDQEQRNREGAYILRETFATKYSVYLEFMIHSYFESQRVVRPELQDGKTEWFLVTFEELRDVIMRVKTFMVRLFDDIGAEGRALTTHPYNTRAASKNRKFNV